jgi:hypothetical protein
MRISAAKRDSVASSRFAGGLPAGLQQRREEDEIR